MEVILDEVRKRGYGELIRQAHSHGPGPVRAVHDPKLIDSIQACGHLKDGQQVYPYVFPYDCSFTSPRTNLTLAGYYSFDVGTVFCKNTYTSAVAATDIAVEAAKSILDERSSAVFALCRPPGHHADRSVYGGLCFFNNAAIAARKLSDHGRAAILDLDFHHGNGSQGIFYNDPHVLYVSIHGDPKRHFPFICGHADEIGAGLGEGGESEYPAGTGRGF